MSAHLHKTSTVFLIGATLPPPLRHVAPITGPASAEAAQRAIHEAAEQREHLSATIAAGLRLVRRAAAP